LVRFLNSFEIPALPLLGLCHHDGLQVGWQLPEFRTVYADELMTHLEAKKISVLGVVIEPPINRWNSRSDRSIDHFAIDRGHDFGGRDRDPDCAETFEHADVHARPHTKFVALYVVDRGWILAEPQLLRRHRPVQQGDYVELVLEQGVNRRTCCFDRLREA